MVNEKNELNFIVDLEEIYRYNVKRKRGDVKKFILNNFLF